MNVLIGCEFRGTVRDAFTAKGHNAISCDLLPTESEGPHIQGDIVDVVQSDYWDLFICHPDCTALTVAGNGTYGRNKPRHGERISAVRWTENLWRLGKKHAKKVCFENPVSVLASMSNLPKAKYIHPWQFGHPEQKKTGLYLHELPPLMPTDNVYEYMITLPRAERERTFFESPGPDRWKRRSKIFQGWADAMADQWNY